jgi:hypothetical protein
MAIAVCFPYLRNGLLSETTGPTIESCATSERGEEVARVLVRKLISDLSGKNSYGIPVGPYASRLLAEAVLIDVDSYLLSERLDFVRWVDDYFFFTRTEQEAQEILIRLAEKLYDRHGLTLSALKTKIQSSETFVKRFDSNPESNVDSRIETIKELSSRFDPYSDEEIELSDEERDELAEIDFAEIIAEALENRDLVDYETLSSLLRHPEVLLLLPSNSRKNLGGYCCEMFSTSTPSRARSQGSFLRSSARIGARASE